MRVKHYLQPIFGLALTLGICSTQAATVIYEDYQFVTEPTVFTESFNVTEAGTYTAKLVDFEFPVAFDILSLGISQGLQPLGIGFGTGSFTFNVTMPGILNAHLTAIPGSQGTGLFGLEIMAVPLPPAAILFFSGILGLVTVARRDKETGIA